MIVQTIIEIAHGSQNKYEYDVTTEKIRLDCVLHPAMHYPVNYGFIPKTWAEHNDPLDVLAMTSHRYCPRNPSSRACNRSVVDGRRTRTGFKSHRCRRSRFGQIVREAFAESLLFYKWCFPIMTYA
ncbi:MAG: hypothetical protein C7B46_12300 [Sulfobacillus benefaciens]|uniref:inorganic diphosphatase n=1 Tax=Sulfobacillus benefaciens TaxID=453960 RepID=A0A2T2XEE7_9FIRM|nr:MAG: hypothetical protein C7B46_12300 [Sulfobacillus benefaciens]